MKMVLLATLMALVVPLPGAHAATLTVGSDAACTHPDLESAIAAAAANGVEDEIRVAVPSAADVELEIIEDTLTLRGGYTTCGDASPGGRTTLVGRDDPQSRVLAISSVVGVQRVSLFDFDIQRAVGTHGGGIVVFGDKSITLKLTRVRVRGHRASRGAGIDMSGPLAGPKLLELADSEVSDNAAETGGGVYCNPGRVDVGVGGRIAGNRAQYGGGVAGRFCQVIVTGDSSTSLSDNVAVVDGGGAYLASNGLLASQRTLAAATGPIIENNLAGGNGGAVFLGSGQTASFSDSVVRGNRAGDSGGVVFAASGSVDFFRSGRPCALLDCGTVIGNRAGANKLTPGRGGVVAFSGGSQGFGIDRQIVSGNSARRGGLVWCDDCSGMGAVSNSVLANNFGAEELIRTGVSPLFVITGTTIVDNRNLLGIVDNSTQEVWLDDSILADPVPLIAHGSQAATTTRVTCSILDPLSPPGTIEANVLRTGDPGFVSAALADYSLREDSVAIDFCVRPFSTPAVDLPGTPRGLQFRSDPGRRFDAGAFERTPLFADGFE